MTVVLLILSAALNLYLFYKYIKAKLANGDYEWQNRCTQLDLEHCQMRINRLRESNQDIRDRVSTIIKRKEGNNG